MRSRSILKVAILSIALMAMPAIAAAQTIELPGTVRLASATLNFTRGQAVSIHFCNVNPVAVNAKLFILDANGNTLKSASGRVLPGQTVGIWFEFSSLPRTSPIRVAVRGAIKVTADPPGESDPPTESDPPGELSLGSMEVYDVLTGRTTYGLLVPAVRNPNVFFPTDQ